MRGTCKLENCLFSHTVSAERAPLCSFFAAGCCNREKCPYSHTYCGKNANFCVEFAKGYCSIGSNVILKNHFKFWINLSIFFNLNLKCNKSHITECPDFSKTNKCPRGKLCPLQHRAKNMTKFKIKSDKQKNTRIDNLSKKAPAEISEEDKMDFTASFI